MSDLARSITGLFSLVAICWGQPLLAQADTYNRVMPQQRTKEAEQSLIEMIELLKDNDPDNLAKIAKAIEKQIVEFRTKEDRSPAEIQRFWKQTVGQKNYARRRAAVKTLVREQNMDNVPGLIYAVSDPDFRIALEAHQGLRLLSRKIDSMKLSDVTIKNARLTRRAQDQKQVIAQMQSEFKAMEVRWTEWFLGIRPEAQLYKPNEPKLGEVSQ